MKYLSLLSLMLFLSVFTSLSQSQLYHHFPTANASWNYQLNEPCQILLVYHSYSLVLDGDTVIGANTYHKLNIPYVETWSQETNCPPFYWGLGFKGAVREDTVTRKLYYVIPGDSFEVLLYDFSLQVGDSVQGYLSPWSCAVVTGIDSIELADGWRKKWHYQTDAGPEEVVEGFGNILFGLLDKMCLTLDAHRSNLQCFSQNGITLYPPDSNALCEMISTTSANPPSNKQLYLFPNPAFSQIRIQFAEPGITAIEIVNSNGKIIDIQKVFTEKVNVNCENLPTGLYMINATGNGKSCSARFIKE